MGQIHLETAKQAKNDEYYTRREDVEAELQHYREALRGKWVYCNCDHPERSEFCRYLADVMDEWGIRRLTATYFEPDGEAEAWHREPGGVLRREPLGCDGDFRSDPCRTLMQISDVVITNPPFSLIREYIPQLLEYRKKFLIIAPITVIKNHAVFDEWQAGRIWTGVNHGMNGFTANEEGRLFHAGVGPTLWLTNLQPSTKKPPVTRPFGKFANIDAINIGSIREIPHDYYGVMGVPISYSMYHCPEQFEILGITDRVSPLIREFIADEHKADGTVVRNQRIRCGAIIPIDEKPKRGRYFEKDGKLYRQVFGRILIRRRQEGDSA